MSQILRATVHILEIQLKTAYWSCRGLCQKIDRWRQKGGEIVYICKTYYIACLMIELHLHSSLGNPTYTATTLSKEEIIDNHKSVLWSFHERWEIWSFLIVLNTITIYISIQTTFGRKSCQMLYQTSFKTSNFNSYSCHNGSPHALWH